MQNAESMQEALPDLKLWRTAKRRLDTLIIPKDTPRKSKGDLEELKASILTHGLLLPLLIEPSGVLRGGLRRMHALLDLFGPEYEVDCILMPVGTNPISAQLAENLHRRELSPLEEARAYKAMLEEFNWSQSRLAKELGLSPSRVSARLNLLSAPQDVQEKMQNGEVSATAVQAAYSKTGIKTGRADWVAARVRSGKTVHAQYQKPYYRIPASKLSSETRVRIFSDTIELTLNVPAKVKTLASPSLFARDVSRLVKRLSENLLPTIRDGLHELKIRNGEEV